MDWVTQLFLALLFLFDVRRYMLQNVLDWIPHTTFFFFLLCFSSLTVSWISRCMWKGFEPSQKPSLRWWFSFCFLVVLLFRIFSVFVSNNCMKLALCSEVFIPVSHLFSWKVIFIKVIWKYCVCKFLVLFYFCIHTYMLFVLELWLYSASHPRLRLYYQC